MKAGDHVLKCLKALYVKIPSVDVPHDTPNLIQLRRTIYQNKCFPIYPTIKIALKTKNKRKVCRSVKAIVLAKLNYLTCFQIRLWSQLKKIF